MTRTDVKRQLKADEVFARLLLANRLWDSMPGLDFDAIGGSQF